MYPICMRRSQFICDEIFYCFYVVISGAAALIAFGFNIR